MMKDLGPRVPFAVVLLLFAAIPALGQADPSGEATIASELGAIRGSLDDIVHLLGQETRFRKAELTVRRIKLKIKRLEPLEEELAYSRKLRDEARSGLQELTAQKEKLDEQRDDQVAAGEPVFVKMIERRIDEISTRIAAARERLEEEERRHRDLELRLARRQEEIDELDAELADVLDALGPERSPVRSSGGS